MLHNRRGRAASTSGDMASRALRAIETCVAVEVADQVSAMLSAIVLLAGVEFSRHREA